MRVDSLKLIVDRRVVCLVGALMMVWPAFGQFGSSIYSTPYVRTNLLHATRPGDARTRLGIVTSNWTANLNQFDTTANLLTLKSGALATNLTVTGGTFSGNGGSLSNTPSRKMINFSTYGASGTLNAHDDTALLQQAILDAMAAQLPLSIEHLPGTNQYLINNTIDLGAASGLIMVGQESAASRSHSTYKAAFKFVPTDKPMFLVWSNHQNYSFQNLGFEGSWTAGNVFPNNQCICVASTNADGSSASSSFDVNMKDCFITGFDTAIYMFDQNDAVYENMSLGTCRVCALAAAKTPQGISPAGPANGIFFKNVSWSGVPQYGYILNAGYFYLIGGDGSASTNAVLCTNSASIVMQGANFEMNGPYPMIDIQNSYLSVDGNCRFLGTVPSSIKASNSVVKFDRNTMFAGTGGVTFNNASNSTFVCDQSDLNLVPGLLAGRLVTNDTYATVSNPLYPISYKQATNTLGGLATSNYWSGTQVFNGVSGVPNPFWNVAPTLTAEAVIGNGYETHDWGIFKGPGLGVLPVWNTGIPWLYHRPELNHTTIGHNAVSEPTGTATLTVEGTLRVDTNATPSGVPTTSPPADYWFKMIAPDGTACFVPAWKAH